MLFAGTVQREARLVREPILVAGRMWSALVERLGDRESSKPRQTRIAAIDAYRRGRAGIQQWSLVVPSRARNAFLVG